MIFAYPKFLWLLLIIPVMIIWYILKFKKANASIKVSSLKGFELSGRNYKYYLMHLLFVIRLVVIALLIIVLARPQSTNRWETESTEGIDIVVALDVSTSMLAEDFKPNRLEASKDVAINFISGREDDRIGLVVFSGESFTQCPLTTDHAVLINLFKDVKSGIIEDGTAIGMGLANAINRLKDSKAISKVIILLTDGENNMGEIAPITAANLASTFGIRVYTIGVGTKGMAPYPFKTAFGTQYQNVEVKIDEDMLREIANTTGGKYYRATSNTKLKEIYEEIDKLEKSKIDVKHYSKKQEEFFWYAVFAVLFLVLEIFIRNAVLRNIP
ncbi:MAG: VWA domain-containing protein [Chlorobi bacterium]|nr:VWA domain-containing protein [Chlorobiota bacterium]